MKNQFLLLPFVALLILFGCRENTSETPSHQIPKESKPSFQLEQLQWIAGKWEGNDADDAFTEWWSINQDGSYSGKAVTTEGEDTLFREFLTILREDTTIYYVPEVAHNSYPVKFELINISGTSAIFENQSHDFPQRISYNFIAPDSLVASIEGEVNGEYRKGFFRMIKAKSDL